MKNQKVPIIPPEVYETFDSFKNFITTTDAVTLTFLLTGGVHGMPSEYVDMVSYEVRKREQQAINRRQEADPNFKGPDTVEDVHSRIGRYTDNPDIAYSRQSALSQLSPAILEQSMKTIGDETPIPITVEDMKKQGGAINLRHKKIQVVAESDGEKIIFNNEVHNEVMRNTYLAEMRDRGLIDSDIANINEEYVLKDTDLGEYDDLDLSGNSGSIDIILDNAKNPNQKNNKEYIIDVDDYEDM